ncbi:restriction endonuclease subunit S [uncultured Veillonella sp.]|uniref:restriction endonuclease subunit S n=1 Tax=uncultured Veillonella sp. TaxID=159268 RepID=UPI00258CBBF1|nr:restriction endonuclease subunit S [uncultured Veillonella sp.]
MEYKFSKLYSWTSGKPISANEHGTIPVYGSNGIIGYTDNSKYFNKIILGRVGAYCGSVEYCPTEFNATDNTLITTCNEKLITYPFAFYSLKFMKLNNFAGGSAQPLITQGLLKHLKCDVPSIEKQKIIANILSAYDNLIENNNKRIKFLEQIAENLYKEWFVRFRFPGYENEHFIEDIPLSWSYVQLGDIASFDRGISYSSDEINCDDGVNLINLKNIQSYGGFRRDGTKRYNGKYKDSQIVETRDLILGVTDMTQDRRTVGSVALIPPISGKSVISADLVKVNLKVPNVFFYCMCRYGFYSKYFSQFANGANVLHLKPNVLLNKKILLPTVELIEAFVKNVQPMIDIVDNLNRQNDLLTKQRDMLLPRLMSGKLEV